MIFEEPWHRRALLKAMAALAAAPLVAVDAFARADADPFALGVASGDPTTDGFVLWTRLVGPRAERLAAAAVVVQYEIATDPQFRTIVRRGRGGAHPERAHAVHVEIADLPAGRPYWYRFHALGATSPTGRAVTAPKVADRLRLAVTSCQHWEQAWFGAYRDIVAADPDLIVQLGDYIYEQSYPDLPRVRAFGSAEPRDLDGYRRRHALYKTDSDLQAAHRACPWIVTWDDHEVLNDYASLANREGLPPAVFGLRRAAAYQAYFEHMPIRPSLWRGRREPRLYRAADWGDLASLSVLDTRQYRSTPPCAAPDVARNIRIDGCVGAALPARTIMGAAQERWLSNRLTREQRPWTMIAQQVFFAPLWLDGARKATFSDQWDGYAANRTRLLQDMQQPAVVSPVVLSGDVHSFWANDLTGVDNAAVGSEIVTSAIAAAPPPAGRFGDVGRNNPHVRFHEVQHSGWVRIEIDRSELRVDMRMTHDRSNRDSIVRSGASFVIPAGTRTLQTA
ncbi:alkaline phosphatase D family protein [Sphingomonas prati]|uniref:Alkaline phosphatase D n=1 Tax=Sphingomonas prati TaxID=1843237 RepID=A0A7W9BSD1_9SPHN|nr:alkaline phosphatase D family protein [Sphingomonas prati]MBB5728708.1 alkaline phosphatase D [Sphingomonas prati]GGE71702.1 alkaline phosphatase [Sphingomonas prati]